MSTATTTTSKGTNMTTTTSHREHVVVGIFGATHKGEGIGILTFPINDAGEWFDAYTALSEAGHTVPTAAYPGGMGMHHGWILVTRPCAAYNMVRSTIGTDHAGMTVVRWSGKYNDDAMPIGTR